MKSKEKEKTERNSDYRLSDSRSDPESGRGQTREFLCFLLGKENYGIEAQQVKEIIPDQTITPVPCTPGYVLGAVYLRGQIMPILNLKSLLELPSEPDRPQARILIVHAQGISVGIKVDEVSEITPIPSDQIQPPLSILDKIKSDHLLGESLVKNRLIILLNLEKVIEEAQLRRKTA